jgi:hypothetical protein
VKTYHFLFLLSATIVCGELSAAIPSICQAETKEEALKLAREVDIPILHRADTAIVIFEPENENIPSLRFEGAKQVLALVNTLTPKKVDPVGLMPDCRIKFYCGEQYLRTVYLVGPIQWGFDRTGIFWPLGDSSSLFKIIQQAKNKANQTITPTTREK